MEPKLIKEEIPDRDTGPSCTKELSRSGRQPTPPTHPEGGASRVRPKGPSKERVKTPDSPEGARLMLSTPTSTGGNSNSASPTTAAISSTSSTLRYVSSSALLQNGNVSPVHNGSAGSGGSLSPPLPPSTALSLSLIDAQTLTATPVAVARTLGKMKRFLSTLVQFGSDIAADTGDRVRALVFNLVSNSIAIEEFHHSLQDVTNFPLRPFVVPFLRAHLPLLQRELSNLARLAKQTPQQYLRHHEHVVLDPAFSPSEASEIFHSDTTENGKRRASDSYYENGLGGSSEADYLPNPKRHHPHLLLQHGSGLLFSPGTGSHPAHVPPPPHLHPAADYPQQFPPYSYPGAPHCNTRDADLLGDRRHGDEEWKNIHVMLNCILSMVEKTKRALAILQHRGAGTAENGTGSVTTGNEWLRRQATDANDARDIKRTAGEIMAQTIRVTEDRVAEVKRRAEEAVNEVKRQAVAELQRAVAAAENKACELVATERAKMEKLLLEARKQAAEEALAVVANQQQPDGGTEAPIPAPSQQNGCWNCGRKANETCSGCNMARYCGSFCQHKDWENHHQVCCGRTTSNTNLEKTAAPTRSASSSRSGTPVTASSSTTPGASVAETRVKK